MTRDKIADAARVCFCLCVLYSLQRAKRLAAENLDEAAEELAELMKEA